MHETLLLFIVLMEYCSSSCLFCPVLSSLTAQYIALCVFIVVFKQCTISVFFAYVYHCEFRPNTATCLSTNVVGLLSAVRHVCLQLLRVQQSDMSFL